MQEDVPERGVDEVIIGLFYWYFLSAFSVIPFGRPFQSFLSVFSLGHLTHLIKLFSPD